MKRISGQWLIDDIVVEEEEVEELKEEIEIILSIGSVANYGYLLASPSK